MASRGFGIVSLTALALVLASCGGGGAVFSTPAPPSASVPGAMAGPPPAPLQSPVEILRSPTTQEFAAFSAGDRLQIRYDEGAGRYEVLAPGQGWDALIDDPLSEPGFLRFASTPGDPAAYFSLRARAGHPDPEMRYEYSSLAGWQKTQPGAGRSLQGTVAFGATTPAGGVPTTGSADYQGGIEGVADVVVSSWGGEFDAPIGGTVSLRFDFARGSLAGEMKPIVACDCDSVFGYPTLSFVDTVFAVGSRTFSGRFDTGVAGPNSFSGLFAGPNAQELIGRWAFPFTHQGSLHSAEGVWIAKQSR